MNPLGPRFEYWLSGPVWAIILDEEWEYEDFIRYMTEAIENDASNWIAYHNRSVANAEIGRKQEAIEDLTKAIELMPESAITYAQRADVYIMMGMAEDAMADYARAIALEPDNLSWLAHRSDAWKRLGDAPKAIDDLTAIINIDPSNRYRFLDRAKLYWSLQMWTEGNADFEVYKDMCQKAREAGEIP